MRIFMGCYSCDAEIETTHLDGVEMPEGWGFVMAPIGPLFNNGTEYVRSMEPTYACPECKDDD